LRHIHRQPVRATDYPNNTKGNITRNLWPHNKETCETMDYSRLDCHLDPLNS